MRLGNTHQESELVVGGRVPPEDMSHQEYEEEIAGGLRLSQSVRWRRDVI